MVAARLAPRFNHPLSIAIRLRKERRACNPGQTIPPGIPHPRTSARMARRTRLATGASRSGPAPSCARNHPSRRL